MFSLGKSVKESNNNQHSGRNKEKAGQVFLLLIIIIIFFFLPENKSEYNKSERGDYFHSVWCFCEYVQQQMEQVEIIFFKNYA